MSCSVIQGMKLTYADQVIHFDFASYLSSIFLEDDAFPLSVVLHHSNVLFHDEEAEREGKAIASVVMSASTPKEIKNLTVPIVFVFDLKRPEMPNINEEEETVTSESKLVSRNDNFKRTSSLPVVELTLRGKSH